MSAIVVVFLIGFGATTWSLLKEREARKRAVALEKAESAARLSAETQKKKSEQVAGFLSRMLKGVGPEIALGRDTTILREILANAAKQVREELKDEPEVEAELRIIIGDAYCDIKECDEAAEMYHVALELRRKVFPNGHMAIAIAMVRLGGTEDSNETLTAGLEMLRMAVGNDHRDVAEALVSLADHLRGQGKLDEAEPIAREAVSVCRRNAFGDKLLIESLSTLSMIVGNRGDLKESETLNGEILDKSRMLFGEGNIVVARIKLGIGQNLVAQKRFAEAEPFLREARDKYKQVGEEYIRTLETSYALGEALAGQGEDRADELDLFLESIRQFAFH